MVKIENMRDTIFYELRGDMKFKTIKINKWASYGNFKQAIRLLHKYCVTTKMVDPERMGIGTMIWATSKQYYIKDQYAKKFKESMYKDTWHDLTRLFLEMNRIEKIYKSKKAIKYYSRQYALLFKDILQESWINCNGDLYYFHDEGWYDKAIREYRQLDIGDKKDVKFYYQYLSERLYDIDCYIDDEWEDFDWSSYI